MSVAEEAFLLLELLHLFLVGAFLDEGVDVEQVALSWNLKTGVLLPDTTITTWGEGPGRRVWPHSLGTSRCTDVHLLLVEGHPVRVAVG